MGVANPVLADVVFQQLPSIPGGNRSSSTLNFLGGSPGFRTADDFVLSSTETISGLNFWGELVEGSYDFTYTFYADNGGAPGTALLTTGGSLSTTIVNPTLNFYTSDLSTPFTATAGTTYWLSIFDQAPASAWAWGNAVSTVGATSRQESNDAPNSWSSINAFNLAFEATTTSVPEPGSIALALIGLVGLGFSRRKAS